MTVGGQRTEGRGRKSEIRCLGPEGYIFRLELKKTFRSNLTRV